MKHRFQSGGRRILALVLSCLLVFASLTANAAAPGLEGALDTENYYGDMYSGWMQLDADEMTMVITSYDPRPTAYLYIEQTWDDYYYVVWSSSNPTVATVDSDGRVTARNPGTAVITARTNLGESASCIVTVLKESGSSYAKTSLNQTSMNLTIQYYDTNPSQTLYLVNDYDSFVYVYQWYSSDPSVATVSNGLVRAYKPGKTTITALTSTGQTLRCDVTVTSDIGKVILNKEVLLMNSIGGSEVLTATVAVQNGSQIPISWVSSNPAVATVNANGIVTAVNHGEAKITAAAANGRTAECYVYVGTAAEKYQSEEEAMLALTMAAMLAIAGVAGAAAAAD
ncbi:MAG: Ig-like domain-containing protein [Faecalibacterium sp.]